MARKCGCDGKPADLPVYEEQVNGKLIRYFNCPTKFIPISVYEWYRIHKMYLKCQDPKIQDLKNMKTIYLLFWEAYDDEISKCQAKVKQQG